METLIRLSTAHAKARLSKNITIEDAQTAIELVQYAYFKRVLEKEKKKRRRRDSGVSSDGENNPANKKSKHAKNPQPGEPGHDPYAYDEDDETDDSHVDEAIRRVTRSQDQEKPFSQSVPTNTSSTSALQEISNNRYMFN